MTNILIIRIRPHSNRPVKPADVSLVYQYWATTKNLDALSIAQEIKNNFRKLLSTLSVNEGE